MTTCEFETDRRYCRQCEEYVRYLRSPYRCYCASCGAVVSLFSAEDMAVFRRDVRRGVDLRSPFAPRSGRRVRG